MEREEGQQEEKRVCYILRIYKKIYSITWVLSYGGVGNFSGMAELALDRLSRMRVGKAPGSVY